jgi:hypothetical protein
MADSKITALTALTAADPVNDMFPVVDVSDTSMAASGTTKRISANNILSSSPTASGALTVTGLVTAGSAAITGDLTVDTSTLKVDSTNNRVGIGTATPSDTLSVVGGNASNLLIDNGGQQYTQLTLQRNSALNSGGDILINGTAATMNIRMLAVGSMKLYTSPTAGSPVERYNIDSTGISTWSVAGTTAMTLEGGGLAIGSAVTGTRRLEVKSAGTSNTTFAAHFRDSADTLLFHVRSDGYFNTGQGALSPYSNTTASAANMFVDSSGFVYRSTSSLKYKTDVKDSIHGLADVLKLRSVTYKSKNGDDTIFGGLIAEEVHAAGLAEFVAYAPDKTPDSINYGNMVALLVSAIQELTARVQTLEAR